MPGKQNMPRAMACWRRGCVPLLIVLLCVRPALADDSSQPEPDYSAELPRIAPTEADKALDSFRLAEGFAIELVAAEPLVTDPVDMAFDENGRLYVVEMRGYSEQGDDQLGQVRLLKDADRDGRFERSTVFAEGLSWPTAVACFDGGVFVGAAPNVFYLKDEDGDGRADRRELVFTGFGRANVQGLINSFRWGLDNRIHIAASRGGGVIHTPSRADVAPLTLAGRDLAFDPRSLACTLTTGGGQFGMSFNRWGEKFVCSNSDHLQMVLAEDRYLGRNPYQAGLSACRSIAADGPQAAVFRASPVEPWRIVRTRLRKAGLAAGPVEGGGRPAGYFTSATGITIYEGDAWPEVYRGWAIVADVGSNLVHRKRLDTDGVAYVGRRVDEQSELLTSSDLWFRPVQFSNGPDGALYIADMYREVVEHPLSLPPEIKRHLDLTSGSDRGRIYRIVPTGFRRPKVPRLGEATSADLVAALDHANAWHRRTAARLLYERREKSAVEPLTAMVTGGTLPAGRLAALYALNSMAELDETTLLAALADTHPQVRRHAVRLSEQRAVESAKLRRRLIAMTDDASPAVRLQLAFSLGEIATPEASRALAQLARDNIQSEEITGAVLSSLRHNAGLVLAELSDDRSFAASEAGAALLARLADQLQRQASGDHDDDALMPGTQSVERSPQHADEVAEREQVYQAFRSVLDDEGDAEAGKAIFERSCATCHQLQDVGKPIGPNLAAMQNRGPEVMLYNILVPNREIDAKYQSHMIVTNDGHVLTGMIDAETATSLRLIDGAGETHTILRIDIDEIVNTGNSLMPTGLEKLLGREGMADLLAYLMAVR